MKIYAYRLIIAVVLVLNFISCAASVEKDGQKHLKPDANTSKSLPQNPDAFQDMINSLDIA